MRPTPSPGLYVQMAGRGTRKSPGKQNCLLLDFAGNVRRHGPIDCVNPKNKGVTPVKECPHCASIVALGAHACPDCGYEWPVPVPAGGERRISHAGSASSLAALGGELTWLSVRGIEFSEHFKPGRPPSLRVDFHSSSGRISDWLAFEHGPGARRFASDKWRKLGGREPIPTTAIEAVWRRGELHVISQIGVRRDGRYWRVAALRKQKLEAAS